MNASCVVCCALVAASAQAADSPESLSSLVTARAEVDAHFKAAGTRLSALQGSAVKANQEFAACKNGRLQLQFGETLARLESSRRALEGSRRATQARRRALETVRVSLEADRRATVKQHRGLEATAAAERTYATQLQEQYLKPLDTEVVGGLDAYLTGIQEYVATLEKYAEFCAAPGYTPAKGTAFVSELAPQVEALVAHATQLGAPAEPREGRRSKR